MNIEIANRLHKLRKDHNMSQEELAVKIGISRQAISKWERAEASPDTDNLILLSKLYGVSLDELLKTESQPFPDDERVSLRKENYSSGTAAFSTAGTIGISRAVVDDDGEIYPNRSVNAMNSEAFSGSNVNSSSIPQGSPFATDYTSANSNSNGDVNSSQETSQNGSTFGNNDGNSGNQGSPFANKTVFTSFDIKDKDKIEKGIQDLSKNLEAGLGHLGNGIEAAGKFLGENLDKAGKKLQEEIKKAEAAEKEKKNGYDNSQNYNYQNNYSYNYQKKEHNKKHKEVKVKAPKARATLLDKLMPMFMLILFGITVPHLPLFAIEFLLLIPIYYTTKSAIRNRNLMHFCYPVLCVMIFFLFGERAMEYLWPIFLTIPLFYTTIEAFRKRNPLIFCYPVLVAYIFCCSIVISGGRLAQISWVLFLTIPFYYIIVTHIMGEKKRKNQ